MIALKLLIIYFFLENCLAKVLQVAPPGGISYQPMIVGGVGTTISSHPYLASLRRSGSHVCGCTILTSGVALTAAHCAYKKKSSVYTVQYGVTYLDSTVNVVQVSSFLVHPDYNPETYENDIALIKLKCPIPFSLNVQPITLANQEPTANQTGEVCGWGATSETSEDLSQQLQTVSVKIIDRNLCNDMYLALYDDYLEIVTSDMICAGYVEGGRDACQGDSGGPLVVDGKQAGIVSWGYGCARAYFPGVYTNVVCFKPWVESNLGCDFSSCYV